MATVVDGGASGVRREITPDDIDYGSLRTFVDVLYGAVLGYGAFVTSDAFSPLLTASPSRPAYGTLLLIGFVCYYFLADAVEARVYNEMYPYVGRTRFLLDVIIAGCFLMAFMAAGRRSSAVLLALGAAMIGGAAWSFCYELDTRNEWNWRWPRILALSHLAAGAAFWWAYYVVFTHGRFVLTAYDALAIWGYYFVLGHRAVGHRLVLGNTECYG